MIISVVETEVPDDMELTPGAFRDSMAYLPLPGPEAIPDPLLMEWEIEKVEAI